jgi:hypothetical protein
MGRPAVVAQVRDEELVVDLKAVRPEEIEQLADALARALV